MSSPCPLPPLPSSHEVTGQLRQLDRRDWWLWSTAITILLLLTAAVAVSTWPSDDLLLQHQRELGVRSLLGLVLLFSVFAVYQQVLIKRLRWTLAEHLARISRLESHAAALQQLAVVDPLTGLYNRRFIAGRLPAELGRAERLRQILTVVALDLDEFKAINDRYGHAAGDCALREFAARLRLALRASDFAVRMGGDEFLLVLPECGARDADEVVARLRGAEVPWAGRRLALTFSAGFAEQRPGESAEALLARADFALYGAKRAPRAPAADAAPVPAGA